MTLAALLGELRHRSVLLDPRGDDLRCLAPKGALTPELRRSIAENKPAILSLLGALGGNGRLETTTAASTNLCLHRLFEAQARRTPDTVAVVSDGEHVSYGELQRHAARLAHVLRTSGVHQETTVAIQNSLSVDTLVAVLAVLGAGGACVPIDPEEPPESVSDHAELAFSLVEKNRAANLVAESTTAVVGDVPSFGDGTRGFHLAYVLSTAGTGGERKWVQLEHRVLADVATFLAWKLGVGEMDVVFADAPFSSDRATLSMWLALVGGARLALASSEPELRDPARLAADLTRSRATLMFETPSRWRRLLSAGWNGRRGIRAVSSGEILDSTLARRLESFGIGLWNVYGCVETANLSAIEEFRPDNGGVAVGGPAPGTDLYVLDDELQPAPVEVGGDLYVGGGSIARGYAKQPDSTAKHFIPDPFARREGARLFRTGDRARWLTDGTLQVLGRRAEARGRPSSGPSPRAGRRGRNAKAWGPQRFEPERLRRIRGR
jgi:non-ribosomal peptide synthetase component F